MGTGGIGAGRGATAEAEAAGAEEEGATEEAVTEEVVGVEAASRWPQAARGRAAARSARERRGPFMGTVRSED